MCWSKFARHDLLDRQIVDFDFDLDWDKCDYVNDQLFATPHHATGDLNIIHWDETSVCANI